MQQNYYYFVFVAVLCNFQKSECLPSPALEIPVSGYHATNSIDTKQEFLESVYVDCTDNKSSVPCFKHKLFAYFDRILNKDEIPLTNGITVIKTPNSGVDGAPRSLDKGSEDSQIKNGDIGSMLLKRVESFLNTHTLKVDLRGTDIVNAVSRAGRTLKELSENYEGEDDDVEESRKKKGGKKGSKMMGHMLMMLKMKLLGLIPLLFGLIALMAGKALLLGKLALLLSLIVLLKKLLASHQKSVTYEIVSHPHSSGGHDSYSSGAGDYSSYGGGGGGSSGGSSHGGSGWGRSADAQSLAYRAYNRPADVKAD